MRRLAFFDSWRVAFLVGVVVFGALALLNMSVFDNAQYALKYAMRYDTSWNGANGRIETERLKSAIGAYLVSPGAFTEEDVQIKLAIVKGRMETWSHGSFGEFVREDPARAQKLEDAKKTLAVLESEIEDLLAGHSKPDIFETAKEFSRLAHSLGVESHQTSIARAAATRQDLQEQQSVQRWIADILIALGAVLLLVVLQKNASLKTASAKAEANAKNFSHLAKHDLVTGLPNRMAFEDKLAHLEQSPNPPRRIGVLAMDLDGFKRINDLLGHAAGDAALQAVSEQLKDIANASPADAMVARVGGDEFLIILEIQDPDFSMEAFAEDLVTRFSSPLDTGAGKFNLGLSVGHAMSCSRKETSTHLALNADLALTEAKAQGKGRAIGYTDDLRVQLERREALEEAMKTAIAKSEIYPVFQPYCDIHTGACIGFEALARWQHPQLGEIGPAEFIPLAEATGDIADIGLHILRAACQEAVKWPAPLTVSVNLSIAQIFRSDILSEVKTVLKETNLDPNRLKLEITESLLITDLDRTVAVLKAFQAHGIRIALDDFGTGYSGLSYLTQFAWDEIKIDRSFVLSAERSEEVRKVVNLVVQIAAQLGATVTVEGIETEDQQTRFANFGCHTAQGFYFGRPQKISDIEDVLAHLKDQQASLRAAIETRKSA